MTGMLESLNKNELWLNVQKLYISTSDERITTSGGVNDF
jgi:hypothetical protein